MLCDAIESVLGQTYPVREIIVVDDGSTDDTARLVRRFGPRVSYQQQENRGVAVARNVGMSLAKGELIAFLDSDDVWYPFKLELQVAVFKQMPGAGLVYSEFDVLKGDGSRRPEGSRTWLAKPTDLASLYTSSMPSGALTAVVPAGLPQFTIHSGSIYRHLLDEALILTSTAIVRRSVLGDSDRFTEGISIFEDWEFFARVARHHDGAFIDVSTTANRGHETPGRLTRCSRLAKTQGYLAMVERIWKADPQFSLSNATDIRRAEGHALLAVAREAILSSRADLAQSSLARWRRLGDSSRSGWALIYSACAALPGGSFLLRQVLRARTLARLVSGKTHRAYSVNPAA